MQEDTNFRPGDIVVGNNDSTKSVYSSTGSRLTDGVKVAGKAEDIAAKQNKILNDVRMSGGEPLVSPTQQKNKKVKGKVKTKSYQSSENENSPFWGNHEDISFPAAYPASTESVSQEPPVKLETIIFENEFGKMRAKVESILDHPQAMLLIFSSDDDVVFEPKIGETLTVYRNKIPQSVYYPGVIFDWTDNIKRAMILFKKEDE
jgi:hypothetical protein